MSQISRAYHFARRTWHRFGEYIEDILPATRVPGINTSYVIPRLDRVLGMRRAGNHAMIDWLAASAGRHTLHINDVEPGRNAFRYRDVYPHVSAPPEHAEIMQSGRHGFFPFELDALLISFEDRLVKPTLDAVARERSERHYGRFSTATFFLVLRDPYNLFASRIKKGLIHTPEDASLSRHLFVDHAKAFLNPPPGLIPISYNRWLSDSDYRNDIQKRAGLTVREVNRDRVSQYGQGSSFDGLAMDGRGSQMAVEARWQLVSDNPLFQQLASDEEVRHYGGRIFGDPMVSPVPGR